MVVEPPGYRPGKIGTERAAVDRNPKQLAEGADVGNGPQPDAQIGPDLLRLPADVVRRPRSVNPPEGARVHAAQLHTDQLRQPLVPVEEAQEVPNAGAGGGRRAGIASPVQQLRLVGLPAGLTAQQVGGAGAVEPGQSRQLRIAGLPAPVLPADDHRSGHPQRGGRVVLPVAHPLPRLGQPMPQHHRVLLGYTKQPNCTPDARAAGL